MTKVIERRKAREKSIARLVENPLWYLDFVTPPLGFDHDNPLTLNGQVPNGDTGTDTIYGVVVDEEDTYTLNGQIDAENNVLFFVTVGADVYFFRGRKDFDSNKFSGSWIRVPEVDDDEDGNWSATTTPPHKDGRHGHHRHRH